MLNEYSFRRSSFYEGELMTKRKIERKKNMNYDEDDDDNIYYKNSIIKRIFCLQNAYLNNISMMKINYFMDVGKMEINCFTVLNIILIWYQPEHHGLIRPVLRVKLLQKKN